MITSERVLAKVVRALNRHLPAKRKSLLALLNEDKPRVKGKDGSTHRFKKEELNKIAAMIPEEMHRLLRLPVYIEMTPDYGRGSAVIRGFPPCEFVQLALDMRYERTDKLIIYRPDVAILRRKFPTTTQYAFFVSTRNLFDDRKQTLRM